MTIHAFTIAAANYLPKVRVLLDSLRRWHPEWRLHLVIADTSACNVNTASVGADEIHYLTDLGIPYWRPWAFTHTLIELATAMKPFALRRLLRRPDASAAIYFDPDIAVFSQLAEVRDGLEEADILLTPHLSSAETTLDGVIANELCTAQHGIYNLGFIAVAARSEGRAFSEWWADRLYHFCREDIPSGIYTDQRWVDFVPAFFDRVKILRSSRFNVAPWNLSSRNLQGAIDSSLTVNGAQLGFYHFSQVDNQANDPFVSSHPAAVALTEWYRATTAKFDLLKGDTGWSMAAFADGQPILREQRLVYRLRNDLQRKFPDPFRTGTNSYPAWWRNRARREFPALFRAATRDAELKWLLSSLVYGRAAAEIAVEFVPRIGRMPWLDEVAYHDNEVPAPSEGPVRIESKSPA